MRTNSLICAFICTLLLTACGQKGDLYLQEESLQEKSPATTSQPDAEQSSEREQADK